MNKDLATPIIKKTAIDENGIAHYLVEGGMTKREVFAGQALAAILSTPEGYALGDDKLAEAAVSAADALLEELSK